MVTEPAVSLYYTVAIGPFRCGVMPAVGVNHGKTYWFIEGFETYGELLGGYVADHVAGVSAIERELLAIGDAIFAPVDACEVRLPEVGSWWRSTVGVGARAAVRRVQALLSRDAKVFVRFDVGPSFDLPSFRRCWEPWEPRQGDAVKLRRGAGVAFEVKRVGASPVFKFQLDDGSWQMASELEPAHVEPEAIPAPEAKP